MIRRPPRSTLSSSSAASDVYKRQGQCCDSCTQSCLSTDPILLHILGHSIVPQGPYLVVPTGYSEAVATDYSVQARPGEKLKVGAGTQAGVASEQLSLIHISEPTRLLSISYAVFCLKKKKKQKN
eukprot:TRINITY_DN52105_c0_g1_i1.p1 TRINITY_DN52105_c0_g1~~TRINITY_DN52105_c0_g1_i1.p1  ORF type:complete len:125 (+),score=31.63 TRINITY_DN52105_c0_g1_i1:110-484(+)